MRSAVIVRRISASLASLVCEYPSHQFVPMTRRETERPSIVVRGKAEAIVGALSRFAGGPPAAVSLWRRGPGAASGAGGGYSPTS